jgi:hypothetical protein
MEFLIPPRRVVVDRGRCALPAPAALVGDRAEDRVPLGQLAADLAARGVGARVAVGAAGPAAVRIVRDDAPPGPDAYRLTVTPDGVRIAASASAGAYYGVQTLRDLVSACGRSLPLCRIDDAPDFRRRGVLHDCSRGKVPRLATLEALVERLARWKINELQLYVENVFTFRRHPAIGRGYSPFTPRDLLRLQDHCRRHHVRLVGCLASFGHMEKILQLPAYRDLGELPGFRGWPGGTTLCPTDPRSRRLVAELYEEYVPLFEAEDFNVCGDEPWELGRGRSRPRARRDGVGRVYLDFLRHLHRLCRARGKRTNAWSDIVLAHPDLLGDLPAETVLLNWDYAPRGERIARSREIAGAGLPLVVCPGTNAWNSHGCRLSAGMANIATFAAEGRRCGAEGLLNTDWGDHGHRNPLAVSLHPFAWGAACAWNGRAARADGFTRRFCRRVLGDTDGRLARAVAALGSAHERLGLPYANRTVLYPALAVPAEEGVRADWPAGEALDGIGGGRLARHARRLAGLDWSPPPGADDPFVLDTLAEFAVASRLDAAACRRAAILRACRRGRRPSARAVRLLREAMDGLPERFEKVWRRRNRPSRLRDLRRDLRRVQGETWR